MSDFYHQPVLLSEAIQLLDLKPGMVVLDATLGGGGHSLLIIKIIGNSGKLICLDQDEDAISHARKKFSKYENIIIVKKNFFYLDQVLEELQISQIDAVLFDLGVSSYQLDTLSRGFSWKENAALDMRMDKSNKITANEIIQDYSVDALFKIFKNYGEERFAKKISKNIIKQREKMKINNSEQLKDIIATSVPGSPLIKKKSIARIFQALRIAVNDELTVIAPALEKGIKYLKPKGRIAVISFHSLEDRIVKQTFYKLANPCTCPASFPTCICGKKPIIKILTRKPILPSNNELTNNIRARSAKLRGGEKCAS